MLFSKTNKCSLVKVFFVLNYLKVHLCQDCNLEVLFTVIP